MTPATKRVSRADRVKIAALTLIEATVKANLAPDTEVRAYNTGLARGYRQAMTDLMGEKFEAEVKTAFEEEAGEVERAMVKEAEEEHARSRFATSLIIASR